MSSFEITPHKDDFILKNKYGVFSKKELEKQLKEGHLTIKELGQIYNLNPSKIIHVLRSLGLMYRNNVGDTRVHNAEITESMDQVIIGTLLGDGYMKDFNRLGVSHSLHQYEYLYHIAERLNPFVASIGDNLELSGSLCFWTYAHDSFIPYFHKFYSKGKQKKYFNEESISGLSEEGLAYWYMDDGKYHNDGPSFCIGKVSKEERQLFQETLSQKFNITSTIQVQNIEKGHYNLYVLRESKKTFFDMIYPYIIPSMKYKVEHIKKPIIIFTPEIIIKAHTSVCNKANRKIRYFGNEEVKKELEKLQIKSKKEFYIEKIKKSIKNGTQITKSYDRVRLPNIEELSDYLKRGYTDHQIAEKFHVSRDSIGNLRRKYNIPRKSCRLSDQQIETLQKLSEKKATIKEMMKEAHLSYYKVMSWIHNKSDKGIPLNFKDIYKNSKFTKEIYKSLSEKRKNFLIQDVVNHYKRMGFPFPHYTEKDLKKDFYSLKNNNIPLDDGVFVNKANPGVKICNHFFPHRYESYRIDKKRIINLWEDDEKLHNFIINRLNNFTSPFTDATIRTGVALKGLPSNFRPIVAKYIYQNYSQGGDILDFCAGYGGRLLGYMASGVQGSYTGIDPSKKSYNSLNTMADFLCQETQKNRDSINIIEQPFEDCNFNKEEFSLIFSSPPYFNLEIYSNEGTQSINRYPEYPQWLKNFWFKTIDLCYSYLKPGGFFIFSLSNFGKYLLVEDTLNYIKKWGYEQKKSLKIFYHNVFMNKNKYENIFIFKKR